jgi:glycogen(starch) synthase
MKENAVRKKFVVVGEKVFLDRYNLFLKCLESYFHRYDTISTPNVRPAKSKRSFMRQVWNGFPIIKYFRYPKCYDLNKAVWAFDYKSHILQKNIRNQNPDLILQIFCLSCPLDKKSKTPFIMSLDYTMALAERNYPKWAEFPSRRERMKWMDRERDTYMRALFLFPWSHLVSESLQKDYGIDATKIVVTGAGGAFNETASGLKNFGTNILLINGSDFIRKGCDIAIEAIKKVRKMIPQVQLIVVGAADGPRFENVIYKGRIKDRELLRKLFIESDLVLAPSRCDPFPGFIIEAMGFGTPCIVSNKDGMPEIVDDNINGLVLRELTHDLLAKSIVSLLSNKDQLQKFSTAAVKKVSSKLNWQSVTKTIFDTTFDKISMAN